MRACGDEEDARRPASMDLLSGGRGTADARESRGSKFRGLAAAMAAPIERARDAQSQAKDAQSNANQARDAAGTAVGAANDAAKK